mmetsp:Transcript_29289/g.93977  ORF Transcript_29289/g.93977 Transcript_29289/m.93977 type:complete len:309 (+) Transcript_29289:118-1044(+)
MADDHEAAVRRVLAAASPLEVLGLTSDCSSAAVWAEELRRSFRRVALRVHPDKNGVEGAAAAFRRVCGALHSCLEEFARAAEEPPVDGCKRRRCERTGRSQNGHRGDRSTAGEGGGREANNTRGGSGQGVGRRVRGGLANEEAMKRPRRTRWWEHATFEQVEVALKEEEDRFFAELRQQCLATAAVAAGRRPRQFPSAHVRMPCFVPDPLASDEDEDEECPEAFDARVSSWQSFRAGSRAPNTCLAYVAPLSPPPSPPELAVDEPEAPPEDRRPPRAPPMPPIPTSKLEEASGSDGENDARLHCSPDR